MPKSATGLRVRLLDNAVAAAVDNVEMIDSSTGYQCSARCVQLGVFFISSSPLLQQQLLSSCLLPYQIPSEASPCHLERLAIAEVAYE